MIKYDIFLRREGQTIETSRINYYVDKFTKELEEINELLESENQLILQEDAYGKIRTFSGKGLVERKRKKGNLLVIR